MASRQLQKLDRVVGAAAMGGAADRSLEGVAVGVDHAGEEQRAAEVVEDRARGVRSGGRSGAHDRAGGVDLEVGRGDPRAEHDLAGEGAAAVRGGGCFVV
jgi:hypothetical protein